ncbi:MAG: hypothetical protein C0508_01205 [Cyanobacteria bacterium PR.023]|nr:hypothetical protein [Cyanobacteria bacterium PR.023]
MKDATKKELESRRPHLSGLKGINFCLSELYADKHKSIDGVVAGHCTYEELIGSLLVARDELKLHQELCG